jgi:FtsP/CotA-like multicopper oxidase with cupredoxin domain
LTLNYHQAVFKLPPPIIQMKPNEKQFWRVVNASLQDFLVLQVQMGATPEQLQVIALDGYPGGTNGPIQFYITVDGQQQKVFQGDEKPAITTKVGAVEDWVVENRALETHAFHIHQIHFRVLEIDGKPAPNRDLRDTIEIPFWEGPGTPYHSVKLRMDFSDSPPGTYVFHCHILLHEDLGMMHKRLVQP